MSILAILILWTWGLTPVWVNIVGTVFLGLKMIVNFFVGCYELSEAGKINKSVTHSFERYDKKK